jgi:hypothetical protein
MASNNLQNKFIQNYGIEILKRKEKYRYTLRTDSTFCGDMAIWEQETGELNQVAVYGG